MAFIASDIAALVGRTPLVRLRGASDATGCEIYAKCEFMNPGGSVKDRAALFIIEDAEAKGQLRPGGTIVEGTAGNTGIGLALIGNAKGYRTIIVIPETQSQEKKDTLRALGAELVEVPPTSYSNPAHYVHTSRRIAEETPGALWSNQFDNIANRLAHIRTNAPEIWEQTGGRVDGFTCACGTGGTLAGVGLGLKEQNPDITIALTDPHGAALYNYFALGELLAEGSSVAEGIGQSRITANLDGAPVDTQYRVADEAGLAGTLIDVADVGHDDDGTLYDLDNVVIAAAFKLYPWEWALRDAIAPALARDKMYWLEPPWKMLLSNKALLPLLWERYPGHPNLLPAYFDASRFARTAFVSKPLLSREGANVSISQPGQPAVEAGGPYGAEGYVYQGYAPLPTFDDVHAVVGAWIVGDDAVGLCVREDRSPITRNTSYFVPHYFEGP